MEIELDVYELRLLSPRNGSNGDHEESLQSRTYIHILSRVVALE